MVAKLKEKKISLFERLPVVFCNDCLFVSELNQGHHICPKTKMLTHAASKHKCVFYEPNNSKDKAPNGK